MRFATVAPSSSISKVGDSFGFRLFISLHVHKQCSCSLDELNLTRITDRVYLAAYSHPPGPHTLFPYPATATQAPSKRSSKSQNAVIPVATGPKIHPPVYFTVDDELLYNRFHADFGPLHIGHLYRFAVQLHEYLGDPSNEERGVVFWSRPDARSRANAACLLACYMIVIQSWPPHLALAPITQQEQPLMPFRDAGYSQADFEIGIQDVVYGVWKAKEEGLCGFQEFNLREYVLLSQNCDRALTSPGTRGTRELIRVTSIGSLHILSHLHLHNIYQST